MDVLTRMYDHHVWLTGQVLDRCDALTDADLDRVIELSVPGIDGTPTLRSLIDRTVRQFEMWATAIEGWYPGARGPCRSR